MEALTAVSVAALTIYDMCKAVDRRIGDSFNSTSGKNGWPQRTLPPRPGSHMTFSVVDVAENSDR